MSGPQDTYGYPRSQRKYFENHWNNYYNKTMLRWYNFIVSGQFSMNCPKLLTWETMYPIVHQSPRRANQISCNICEHYDSFEDQFSSEPSNSDSDFKLPLLMQQRKTLSHCRHIPFPLQEWWSGNLCFYGNLKRIDLIPGFIMPNLSFPKINVLKHWRMSLRTS